MSARELKRLMTSADPVDRERLGRLDFAAMEGELAADLEEFGPSTDPGRVTIDRAADAGLLPRPRGRRPRNLVLAGGGAALAVVIALVIVLAGGGSSAPSRAYGAELVRFADRARCCCSKRRAGGSRTSASTGTAKAPAEPCTSSPASRSGPHL